MNSDLDIRCSFIILCFNDYINTPVIEDTEPDLVECSNPTKSSIFLELKSKNLTPFSWTKRIHQLPRFYNQFLGNCGRKTIFRVRPCTISKLLNVTQVDINKYHLELLYSVDFYCYVGT